MYAGADTLQALMMGLVMFLQTCTCNMTCTSSEKFVFVNILFAVFHNVWFQWYAMSLQYSNPNITSLQFYLARTYSLEISGDKSKTFPLEETNLQSLTEL